MTTGDVLDDPLQQPGLIPLQASLAKAGPNCTAIQFREHRSSYSELAEALASTGTTIGRLAGLRVLVLMPDSPATYLVHLHCFLSGATVIPQSPLSTTPRLQQVCQRAKPHLVATTKILYQKYKSILEDYACLLLSTSEAPLITGPECDFLGTKTFSQLPILSSRESENIRAILFTSGSTGVPKGVCLSESNILSAASMMVDFLSFDPSRKSFVTVPFYDYYGFIQIFGHVLGAAGFTFGESLAAPDALVKRLLSDDQLTDLVLVPHTLRQLLDKAGERASRMLRRIKIITSSSDILSEELCLRTFSVNSDLRIVNIYGLTEAGRACNRHIFASTPYSRSIGRPSRGVQIRVDGDQRRGGEVIIRGPNVMRGYLSEIQEDRISYAPCDEMRTGDLGYFDDSGEIILVGRKDHMINLMGAKLHPVEIESLTMTTPGIRDAYAYVTSDASGNPSISLDVVVAQDEFYPGAIQDRLRKHLPRAFVPTSINSVREIRRTELGSKVVRGRGDR